MQLLHDNIFNAFCIFRLGTAASSHSFLRISKNMRQSRSLFEPFPAPTKNIVLARFREINLNTIFSTTNNVDEQALYDVYFPVSIRFDKKSFYTRNKGKMIDPIEKILYVILLRIIVPLYTYYYYYIIK